MSPEPPLRVLVIGLDPRRVPGPWDPEPVVQKVEAGLAKFAEHGVGVAACLVGLDDSDDVQAVIVAALKGHAWECVTIGGGMRHAKQSRRPVRASGQSGADACPSGCNGIQRCTG